MTKPLAVMTTALLATGLAVGVAAPASAHNQSVTATCSALTVNLMNYRATVPATETTYTTVPNRDHVPASTVTSYQRYSWNGGNQSTAPTEVPPSANWQANTTNYEGAGGGSDPVGTPFQASKGQNASWFYWTKTDTVTPAIGDPTIEVVDQEGTPEKTNHVTIAIDGITVPLAADTDFSTSYDNVFDFANSTESHSWVVTVTAWDDPTGTSGWTKTLTGSSTPCSGPVAVMAVVTSTPPTCSADGALVVPTQAGVVFYGNGVVDGAGPGTYKVKIKAAPGFELDKSYSSYTVKVKQKLTGDPCLTAVSIDTDPSVSSCMDTGDTDLDSWIFVALNDQVVYKINGTVATASYTQAAPGVEAHVTAEAADGFTLVGTHAHEWYVTPTSVSDCQLIDLPVVTPVVTQTAATCSVDGSYTLGVAEPTLADHVVWTVNGETVAAGTYSAPAGTQVHVVVTAVEGSGINTGTEEEPADQVPSMEWTLTIASPSAACGELETLALTGADGNMGGMLMIALFLLLGGAGVYTASRVRSREG
jgi:hypothetical protein